VEDLIVVFDTSPLIFLNRLGYLEKSLRLFQTIIIPKKVLEEIYVKDDKIKEDIMLCFSWNWTNGLSELRWKRKEEKMPKQRRHYSPEKKVEILREHFKNKMPVSELCEKYGIHPNMFYKWEKQFFEGAINTFANNSKSNKKSSKEEQLKQKIARMQEVITELTQENIILKKKYNGEI